MWSWLMDLAQRSPGIQFSTSNVSIIQIFSINSRNRLNLAEDYCCRWVVRRLVVRGLMASRPRCSGTHFFIVDTSLAYRASCWRLKVLKLRYGNSMIHPHADTLPSSLDE